MANTLNEEAAGAAIAAFALAQMVFWQLLRQGLLEKSEAEEMLGRAVETSDGRDRVHGMAAKKLARLLHIVEAYQPPGPTGHLVSRAGAHASRL